MARSNPMKGNCNQLPATPAGESGLTRLIQRGHLFIANQQQVKQSERLPTGYPELDKLLGGGLGLGALHELQTACQFAGESLFFKAALQQAHVKQQAVFWLNPPAQPFLPGLGVDQAQHTVIDKLHVQELQWASTQILRELEQGVVLIWQQNPSAEAILQWQRAIPTDSQVFALVITQHMPHEARAFCNRIRLNQVENQIFFEVLKRQGGWPTQTSPEPLRPWS